jgi:ABC-type sugar transport system substrate-binding protein/AraC-like DNA-binding protein
MTDLPRCILYLPAVARGHAGSSMLFSEDKLLIFWNTRDKEVPPRPRKPESYPEDDERHWYDREYAGWGIKKLPIPESTGDGPQGKRVVFLQPGLHPYHVAFAEGLGRIAERSGIRLTTLCGNMTREGQDRLVRQAIDEKPDLVILVPINTSACTRWVQEINGSGIPVIGSNYIPDEEAYRSILAWCGPDDWGQYRMLARTFAGLMGYQGGYAIIRHIPGTSCWFARTYAVITELRKAAPRMRCLAMAPSCEDGAFDPAIAHRLVSGWIEKYGDELKGIVGPDDDIVIDGINEALRKAGREDIIRVGAGSTQKGMQLVKQGDLHAITFQSAQADGALPMKIAVDWFNGLDIAPINYLPKYIISKDNVDGFLSKKPEFTSVSLAGLTRAVLAGSDADLDRFFEDAYQSFLSSELMTQEFFRGFSIEVLSTLIHILKMNDLDEQALLSDYESLYKNLFNQKTPRHAMEWMKRTSLAVVSALAHERQSESLIERIVRYVNRNYAEQLSLKVLSCQFGISAPYLGRLFRQETGKPFATYMNELRLRKADELVRYTSLKASEIAVRIGYANVNYFYTLYKKFKGYDPSETRSAPARDVVMAGPDDIPGESSG